jgi:hypothetical protein
MPGAKRLALQGNLKMEKPFKISEIKSGIFLFEFKNNYDMCMHFLRYQEFYESASAKFRGKKFEIFDFMKWYSFKYGRGVFTYTNDWDGFNIPGDVIKKVYDLHIDDKNIFDHEMLTAWNQCSTASNGKKFYIIGVVKKNGALSHEIAHALFYLYPEYKKEMTRMIKELSPSIRKEINLNLKKLGYTPKVYLDETQAYMATGLTLSFQDHNMWPDERKIFKKYFREFSKTIK